MKPSRFRGRVLSFPAMALHCCRLSGRPSGWCRVSWLSTTEKGVGEVSKWTNPEEWERLRRAESCPVCLRGRPTDCVAELDASYLLAGEDAPMRGYCFLLLKRHAVELYELLPEEAAAFMRGIQRVSAA